MITKRHVFLLAFSAAAVAGFASQGAAQNTIKIGELNSYKTQSAFLDPYKKGMELALEEVNSKGGVLGKKLELITRDDGTNPGEAVRVAEELITREGVSMIAGTFLSHIGLAVTNFAGQKKVFFLAAEPLTGSLSLAEQQRVLRPSGERRAGRGGGALGGDAVGGRGGRGAEGVEVGLRGGEGGHGEVLSPSGGEAEPRGTTAPGGAVVGGGQLPPRATSGSIRVTR